MKYYLVVVLALFGVSVFAETPPSEPAEDSVIAESSAEKGARKMAKARYTLLGVSTYNFGINLKCEIAVLVDYHRSELKIIRLNEPSKTHNTNQFRNYPGNYSQYGKVFEISRLFPNIAMEDLTSVGTMFKLNAKGKTLRIEARLKDGQKEVTTEPIAEYYDDQPTTCLK